MTENQNALLEAMPAQIRMPYTLTPGTATGIFLAELSKQRLLASKHGSEINFPPADFSRSGVAADGFIELAPVGEVVAFTETIDGVLGLVRIDGTDVPLAHRLVGFSDGQLEVGARVEAVWAETPAGDSVMDLAGFGPERGTAGFEPREITGELSESPESIEYSMTLDYQHAYGHYYGTFFDGVRTDRRLRGIKCTACERVLLPPRGRCDACFEPTGQWVDVASTGTVQASSVVHIEFIGQRMKPPYVYAEIVLDGASTRLIHMIGNVDPDEAKTSTAPGARVRAVWSDRHTGSLADIEYFEVIE
ncbi:OB-fold domain-containing protein [Leucobacter sp. Z1108]|uniref:OB-fold nucleic acid binding domain-containing protein n=1 Tax=Leucobacter sp. Z1108 TaxID=3439066 RepID=UPI003F31BB36